MKKGPTIKNDSKQALIKNDSKQGNLLNGLNEQDEAQIFKPFKRTGTEGSSILIGLYYKGASELTKLKGYSSPQNTFNAAQRLILKGLLGKNGHIYFLTDKGRDLVSPFIEYARNNTPAY